MVECCPEFKPETLDGKTLEYSDKLFVKEHSVALFHIPLGIGPAMVRALEKINSAGALVPDATALFSEKSMWGTDIYIEVKKDVPGAKMERISGTFMTKVFVGDYKDVPKWIKEMEAYLAGKGKTMKDLYMNYRYCPKCAKKFGKNYVVLFAKV